ncbi:uncharacterized protein [Clytia hemisphaerica]|uniref:Cnidarian restricted protein n=1 Tax=Clytia hemisphaerica TaxID=252671 RepID=A0A7M5X5Z7_9CNID
MQIWKILLLLSFLAATVYCEESNELQEENNNDEQVEDEPSALTFQDEEIEQEENEIEDEQQNDAAPRGYKTKVYTEKNKNAGECKRINWKRISCWNKKVGSRVERRCKMQYSRQCKICSRFYYRTCTSYHGCKNGPLQPRQCARKIVGKGFAWRTAHTSY